MVENVNSITIGMNVYKGNTELENIDLRRVPWQYNTMRNSFMDCSNLVSVTNINGNVQDMWATFKNCPNLSYVSYIPNSVTNAQYTFADCTNLVDAPDIPYSVTSMEGTFMNCTNLTGDIFVESNSIWMADDCFANTSLDKNVYVPFFYENGLETQTLMSFWNCGYNPTGRNNGAQLYDFNLLDWRYESDYAHSPDVLLYRYEGNDTHVKVPPHCILNKLDGNQMDVLNTPFAENQNIVSVDLSYSQMINNSSEGIFFNCQNLTSITNINGYITDMTASFYTCFNLVNAPAIPNSVISMPFTFLGCSNLVNAPDIPNSVTNTAFTFLDCSNLVNASAIPNSVMDMTQTFANCINLVNAPDMNNANSIIGMYRTFENCYNLTGDIYINSENITLADYCFDNTWLEKNVYIPFTYQNGVPTSTYNSFINAGYGTDPNNRINGICLFDINEQPQPSGDVDVTGYNYTMDENNNLIIEQYTGSDEYITAPHLS